MASVYLGTCSWKYPSWHGLVYSSPRGINYLREYATRYGTVEIDQWFWSLFGPGSVKLPAPKDVLGYAQSVPSDFRFTVKAPNSITLTHLYRKYSGQQLVTNPHFLSTDLMRQFIKLLGPLRDRLGPIILQYEYLNRDKMPSARHFRALLGAFMGQIETGVPLAIEVRNAGYLDEEHYRLLLDHKLIPVLMQGYWMPPIWEHYETYRELISAHKTVILRLMGPHRGEIEKLTGSQWNRVAIPRDQELERIARVITDLVDHKVTVYVNVNNHYEGSAPLTIDRLVERLGDVIPQGTKPLVSGKALGPQRLPGL